MPLAWIGKIYLLDESDRPHIGKIHSWENTRWRWLGTTTIGGIPSHHTL